MNRLLATNQDNVRTRQQLMSKYSNGVYSLIKGEYSDNFLLRGRFINPKTDTSSSPVGTGKYYDLYEFTDKTGIRDQVQYRKVVFENVEDIEKTYDSSLWSYRNQEVSNGVYDNYYDYSLNAYNYRKHLNPFRVNIKGKKYWDYFNYGDPETYFTIDENDDAVGVFRDWKVYTALPNISAINDTVNPNSEVNDTPTGYLGNIINKYMMQNAIKVNDERDMALKESGRRISDTDYALGMLTRNFKGDSSSTEFIKTWNWEQYTKDLQIKDVDAILGQEAHIIDEIKEEDLKKDPSGVVRFPRIAESVKYNKESDTLNLANRYSPVEKEQYVAYTKGEEVKLSSSGGTSGITITTVGKVGINEFEDEAFNEEEYFPDALDNDILPQKGTNILYKTSQLFKNNKINSLIGVSRTTDISDPQDLMTDTVYNKYGFNPRGNAHRTWTKGYRYGQYGTWVRNGNAEEYQNNLEPYRTKEVKEGNTIKRQQGGKYLIDNTVIQKNGFVRITPSTTNKDLGRTMFSIENLAWKDSKLSLNDYEKGPNGGRIMWFVPYALSFNENSNVSWNENRFIGRGERIYTYQSTIRTANLSFKLITDSPTAANIYAQTPKDVSSGNNHGNAVGSGENKGKDSIHYDILRYFAGCDTKKLTAPPPDINITPEGLPVEPQVKPGEGKKLTISVYFPNNYTGHYEYDPYTNKEMVDSDFEKYILNGKNASTKSIGNGYCCLASGVTDSGDTSSIVKVYRTKTELEDCFYRVDADCINGYKGKINTMGIINKKFKNDIRINYKDIWPIDSTQDFNLNKRDGRYCFFDFLYVLNEIYKEGSDIENANTSNYAFGWEANISKISSIIDNLADSGKTYFKDRDSVSELAYAIRQGKITKVLFNGVATSQDPNDSNRLAHLRASAMKSLFGKYINLDKIGIKNTGVVSGTSVADIHIANSSDVKLNRRCDIEIYYNAPETEDESKTTTAPGEEFEETEVTTFASNDTANAVIRDFSGAEYMNFEMLGETYDPTNENIHDKMKHFTPGFHSTTPEGFNMRINFLQQCTRQGHTCAASDGKFAANAGNLAFGRQPVCVLRIGDFIYSKIIINSINIKHGSEGIIWDMNPEGIGVQPMYADVSINFTFIGGEALTGPLERIQNGTSFNYYANTGVYDGRADQGNILENNSTPTEEKVEQPTQKKNTPTVLDNDEDVFERPNTGYAETIEPKLEISEDKEAEITTPGTSKSSHGKRMRKNNIQGGVPVEKEAKTKEAEKTTKAVVQRKGRDFSIPGIVAEVDSTYVHRSPNFNVKIENRRSRGKGTFGGGEWGGGGSGGSYNK